MSETPPAGGGRTKKSESLGKRAKKGAVWSFVREGGSELLLFPSSMVLARLLSPEEFGIAAAAGFFTLLAGQLAGLGLNAALIRIKDLRPEHSSTVFAVNVTVGLIMCAALYVGSSAVAAFYGVPETGQVLRVSAFGFIISSMGTVPAAILTRDLRFKENAMTDWYNLAVFSGTSLVLAWLGFSYMSMVYGRIAGLVALTTSRMLYSPWRPSLRFSWPALREILSFGTGVYAKRLLDYGARNLDNLVVGKFYGMVTLGIYDKAFSTVNRFLTRLNAGGPGVTFRIFAIIQEQPERFVGAYRKVVLSTSLLALPIFTVLMVVAPQFMVFLFGARWRPAALPFQILCLSGYLKLLNTYASSATQAAGYIWSEVWRQVLYVTLIVGSLVLLRGYGAPGAAVGVLAATALMTILMHWLLLRVTSLTPWGLASAIGPGAACALTAGGGVWLLQVALARWAPVPDVVLLLGQAVLATVLFVGFLLFAPLRELRALVVDVYTDLAPGFVKRRAWVGRMIGVGPAGAVVPGGTGR